MKNRQISKVDILFVERYLELKYANIVNKMNVNNPYCYEIFQFSSLKTFSENEIQDVNEITVNHLENFGLVYGIDYLILHPKDETYTIFENLFKQEIEDFLIQNNCKVEIKKCENDFKITIKVPTLEWRYTTKNRKKFFVYDQIKEGSIRIIYFRIN